MICHFKIFHVTIISLVMAEKICLILLILHYGDMIKDWQEEMDSS